MNIAFSNRWRALLVCLVFCGCGSRARFEIVRPALLDASPFGNTFSVQPFSGVDPNAAYRAQAMIEQRVQQSLNPSIQLLAGGGGVMIGGSVVDHSYSEQFVERGETCTRTEYYNAGRGRSQSRTISYPCVRIIRSGFAHSAIRFSVIIASTGQIVWDRIYEDSRRDQTSAINGTPPGINAAGMLDSMLVAAVDEFARVILPWPDTVEVEFSDCGHADGCDEAWELVRANDLRAAEAVYTRILGPYDDASTTPSEDDREIVADTLFNRGVVRAYTGSYELGLADIQRALSIRPEEEEWREELGRIESLANEQDQLRTQIEGGTNAPAPVSPTAPPSVTVEGQVTVQ